MTDRLGLSHSGTFQAAPVVLVLIFQFYIVSKTRYKVLGRCFHLLHGISLSIVVYLCPLHIQKVKRLRPTDCVRGRISS